jgi:hypothetical protein
MVSESQRAWIWIAIIIGVLAMLTATAATTVYLLQSRDIARQRLPFESAAWRADSRDPEAGSRPTRQRMASDLLARRQLDGLPRKQVEAMLGPDDAPGRWPKWHLKYQLGPAPGSWLDRQWLVIRFGPDGRVAEYRLVVD